MQYTVGVVGAGLMGRQIALASAVAGHQVHLFRATPGPIEDRESQLRKEARLLSRQAGLANVDQVLSQIHLSKDLSGISQAGIVIESVSEDVELKKSIYSSLLSSLNPAAILCTNTSSLKVSQLAEGLGTVAPRFLGLHFFSPVFAIPVVEVATCGHTSAESTAIAISFVESLSKTAVKVSDTPGYVVNRVLFAALASAAEVVSAGVATKEVVDQAIRMALGWPLGPFKLIDRIGSPLFVEICRNLEEHQGNGRFRLPEERTI